MSTPSTSPQAGRAGSLPGDRTGGDYAPYEALRGAAGLSEPPRVEPSGTARERVVFVMMVLVAAAAGGMMHVQADFSLPVSILGGIIALGTFMIANALVGRSAEVTRLRLEIARLEHEMARMKTQGIASPRAGASTSSDQRASWQPAAANAAANEEARKSPEPAREGTIPAAASAAVEPGPDSGANVMPQVGQAPDPRWEVHPPRKARIAQPAAQPATATAAATPKRGMAVDTKEPQKAAVAHGPMQQPSTAGYASGAAFPDDDVSELPDWPGTSQSTADPMRDSWGASPRGTAAAPAYESAASAAPLAPGRTVEADLQMVQRKIKALADEVNANEALRGAHAAEPPAAAIDDSIAALRTTAERMKPPRKGFAARPIYTEPVSAPASRATAQPQPAQPAVASQPAQPAAASQPFAHAPAGPSSVPASPSGHPQQTSLPSLDALIPSTAQPIAVSQAPAERAAPQPQSYAPREPQAPAPRPSAPIQQVQSRPQPSQQQRASEPSRTVSAAQSEPARQTRQTEPQRSSAPVERRSGMGDRRLAEIAAAIDQRRMDVFLNPIVGLGDYAVTHFEVNVRLKAEGGDYIDDAAATLNLHATDLLALFDIERLERTARVAEQLEARGKTGALLSPTAGQSMTDGKFLEAFARTFETRTSISGQLVLTFSQADITAFGPGTWQALADMHSFGFRFALEHVTHLATDFAGLAERGFAFVKLPAEAFLDGLPAGHGMVPPADICRHMAGAGLTLVVEAIDDDQLLARVFGFGALFGQGSLFGGSRQITLEALGDKRTAA